MPRCAGPTRQADAAQGYACLRAGSWHRYRPRALAMRPARRIVSHAGCHGHQRAAACSVGDRRAVALPMIVARAMRPIVSQWVRTATTLRMRRGDRRGRDDRCTRDAGSRDGQLLGPQPATVQRTGKGDRDDRRAGANDACDEDAESSVVTAVVARSPERRLLVALLLARCRCRCRCPSAVQHRRRGRPSGPVAVSTRPRPRRSSSASSCSVSALHQHCGSSARNGAAVSRAS